MRRREPPRAACAGRRGVVGDAGGSGPHLTRVALTRVVGAFSGSHESQTPFPLCTLCPHCPLTWNLKLEDVCSCVSRLLTHSLARSFRTVRSHSFVSIHVWKRWSRVTNGQILGCLFIAAACFIAANTPVLLRCPGAIYHQQPCIRPKTVHTPDGPSPRRTTDHTKYPFHQFVSPRACGCFQHQTGW